MDELLKSRLNRPQGLADPAVKILDPATGTGTFLAQAILHIHEQFEKANNSGAFDADYIEKKLVPRLFGFELLVAPYTVAHLKLNLLLRDLVPNYDPNRRLEVYLTNSLEPPKAHPELPLSEFISDENNHAAQIKANENILVVIGNPPYSGHSANNGMEIKALLHGVDPLEQSKGKKATPQPDYFKCDGKPLGERNPKWLNDDYVKFIRFAQWRIDRTGEGVLGFITNHGYLDNPTFRGMRQALMQSFSEIHVLDLHGNDRKKEIDPSTGLKDENVFDIQQGVAILLAVKRKDLSGPCQVFHADLYGKRAVRDSNKRNAPIAGGKYAWLWENSASTTKWSDITGTSITPNYYMCPAPKTDSYEGWASIKELMPENGWGIASRKDYLLVDQLESALIEKFTAITSDAVETSRAKWKIKSSPHWSFEKAVSLLPKTVAQDVHPIMFRPLDTRYIYYRTEMIERGDHRYPLMRHMLKPNLSLLTVRRLEGNHPFRHIFVSSGLSVLHTVAMKEGNFVFPLYLYPSEGETDYEANPITGRRPNFSDAFLATLGRALGTKRALKAERASALSNNAFVQYKGLPEGVSPEDIFYYIYAVLHSPGYRSRYADFLKMDFPRVPLPVGIKFFKAVAARGRKLVALHLMDLDQAPELSEMRHGFPISGSNSVEDKFPQWREGRVWINNTQYFDAVPEDLWTYTIGGYQVPQKWLKDRRDRKLSADDRTHYQRTLIALEETSKEMTAIDESIERHGGWPGAFFGETQ